MESIVAPSGMFSNVRFSAEEAQCKNTIDIKVFHKVDVKLRGECFSESVNKRYINK